MGEIMVSIVVLAFDNLRALLRSVETIKEHTAYGNFEIIVAHNPCGDADIDASIRDQLHIWNTNWGDFKFIILDKNRYHAKGCMMGYSLCDEETELVVFCNDDIFIPARESDWLERMALFMQDNPNVATLTPALYHGKETIYWIGKQDPNQPTHDFLHVPKGSPELPTQPLETCYNNFALVMIRKALVDEIPLGQSCPHYGSDSEFCNRVKDAHPDMIHMVDPRIRIYHYNIYSQRINHGKEKVIEG